MTKHKHLAAARRKVRKEGFASATRHILLCCDRGTAKCASRKQMRESWQYLKKRLKELKLDKRGGVFRSKSYCLDICVGGPIAVVMPDNCWYGTLYPSRAGSDYPGTLDRRCSCREVSSVRQASLRTVIAQCGISSGLSANGIPDASANRPGLRQLSGPGP